MRLEQTNAADWLPALLERLAVQLLNEWAEISSVCRAEQGSAFPPCAVSIIIDGAYGGRLWMCAEKALFYRMAQGACGCSLPSSEDVEETAKEFLNILCGRLISAVYEKTKIPARFYTPCFCEGEPWQERGFSPGQALWFCSGPSEHFLLCFTATEKTGKEEDSYEIPAYGNR